MKQNCKILVAIFLCCLNVARCQSDDPFKTIVTYLGTDFIMQVLISSTFYEQLFRTKVFCAAFLHLQFGIVIFFLQKHIGTKADCMMLMKLVKGLDFIKILQAAFALVDLL
jgi:hypothetical protein